MEIKLSNKPQVKQILIVHSKFNHFIVKELLEGAMSTLIEHGVRKEQIDALKVPGAYEIPLAIKSITNKKKYDGVIGLGCIIEGETSHYEFIINHLTKQLGDLSLHNNLPLALGILTVKNINQAIERSGGKLGNKGEEAANALIEMIKITQYEF